MDPCQGLDIVKAPDILKLCISHGWQHNRLYFEVEIEKPSDRCIHGKRIPICPTLVSVKALNRQTGLWEIDAKMYYQHDTSPKIEGFKFNCPIKILLTDERRAGKALGKLYKRTLLTDDQIYHFSKALEAAYRERSKWLPTNLASYLENYVSDSEGLGSDPDIDFCKGFKAWVNQNPDHALTWWQFMEELKKKAG
jgi:hypothetical protein